MNREEKRIYWKGYNGALEMVEAKLEEEPFGEYDGVNAFWYKEELIAWLRKKKMVNIELKNDE